VFAHCAGESDGDRATLTLNQARAERPQDLASTRCRSLETPSGVAGRLANETAQAGRPDKEQTVVRQAESAIASGNSGSVDRRCGEGPDGPKGSVGLVTHTCVDTSGVGELRHAPISF
jgi:hypothetical protein